MRMLARFIGSLFTTFALAFVVLSFCVAVFLWHIQKDLPDTAQLQNYEPPVLSRLHASDGSVLAEYARERRLYLPASSIPPLVKKAFIAAEDKRFYSHNGVDVEAIARALLAVLQGRNLQGGSTITQQVAKNFFTDGKRTLQRKMREIILSFRIETAYSKEKILELYLNEIFLGYGSYGIAAAALNYYGKSVHELTIPEVAYLAALPKAPMNYHPSRNYKGAISRRNYVLDRMIAQNYISEEEGSKAREQPLVLSSKGIPPHKYEAGYFTEEVRRELIERYGEKKLYEGGLSVRTTLDPQMQIWARKALVDGLVRFDQAHGYRGALRKIDLHNSRWQQSLDDISALADVMPWRLAVVLSTNRQMATLAFQSSPSNQSLAAKTPTQEKKTLSGIIRLEGISWTKKRSLQDVLDPGDVIYVEPLPHKPGEFQLRQIPKISGALVAMDPHTGRVHAMVGGFSSESEFNRATQAFRQPGSSFKPFIFATALDNGYTPSSIILNDPVVINQGNGQLWKPENFEKNTRRGAHTLRYAVEHSMNLMTVRLARDLGMPIVAHYANNFGIYDQMPPLLSMSLGAGETTVLKMVTAYSMLDNGGKRITPTLIDRIQDRFGRTIYRHDTRLCQKCDAHEWQPHQLPPIIDQREQVIDALTAYQITHIMAGVVDRGTGVSVKAVGKHLAGKTGTTNEAKDLWFVGFSPDLAVGVYLGYDKPKSMGNAAQAATWAAPIFRDFMHIALKDKPNVPFRIPPGIKLISVDLKTGQRSTGKNSILEAFKPGTEPAGFPSLPDMHNQPFPDSGNSIDRMLFEEGKHVTP